MLRPFLVRQHVQVRTSEEIHLSHLDLSARLHHVERQRHDAGGLQAVMEHTECRQIGHGVSGQAAFDSDCDSTHGSRERPGREADGEVGVRGSRVSAEPSLQRLVAEPVKRCQHKREVTTQQLLEEPEVCLAVAHQRRARP